MCFSRVMAKNGFILKWLHFNGCLGTYVMLSGLPLGPQPKALFGPSRERNVLSALLWGLTTAGLVASGTGEPVGLTGPFVIGGVLDLWCHLPHYPKATWVPQAPLCPAVTNS